MLFDGKTFVFEFIYSLYFFALSRGEMCLYICDGTGWHWGFLLFFYMHTNVLETVQVTN